MISFGLERYGQGQAAACSALPALLYRDDVGEIDAVPGPITKA
jgi:hypothetical protein